jgi:hypothetical protein
MDWHYGWREDVATRDEFLDPLFRAHIVKERDGNLGVESEASRGRDSSDCSAVVEAALRNDVVYT